MLMDLIGEIATLPSTGTEMPSNPFCLFLWVIMRRRRPLAFTERFCYAKLFSNVGLRDPIEPHAGIKIRAPHKVIRDQFGTGTRAVNKVAERQ